MSDDAAPRDEDQPQMTPADMAASKAMTQDGAEQEAARPSFANRGWTYLKKRLPLMIIGIPVGILLLIALAVALLDTGPGRRFVADQIAALQFENGMQIEVGRIDGSLYGEMVLHDLSVKDLKGEFLYSPEVHVDWRPFSYLKSHVDVHSATAQRVLLRRVPELRETPPSDEPLLPDLDIDIRRLKVDRLIAEKAVTGEERIARLDGRAHIADGRAQVTVDARTLQSSAGGGGDVLALVLDAVPEANRLDIDMELNAPRDGVIAALGGLAEPLRVTMKGKGDWAKWVGDFDATYAEEPLADLAVESREGTFTLKGPLTLGKYVPPSTAALLAPQTDLDLSVALKERKADIVGTLISDAMRLNANGGVDLSDNTFDGLKLAFVLMRPSAIAPNLSGSGLRAMLTLDGAFATPKAAYTINANRISMNDMGLEQFEAKGNARVDADRIMIPVSATAKRITGLDTVAGGTLANVRLDGDVAIDGPRILSDNMRIRSDRIDAKAILLANMETGLYTGAIDGKIDNYRLESVGIFNIETDMGLEMDGRGYALKGKVRARSTRLLNDTLATYLGGNFVASSDVLYGSDGTAHFANLRLEAPDLRVVGGNGSYSQNGQIRLNADGVSKQYGKVGVRVTGTLTNPDARITADRPDLGIGLADLNARITGARNGYRLVLTGNTDYGPLTGDVVLGMNGPLRIDINSANLSGVDFTGSLEQTKAGPFAGTLRANGNGMSGIATLDALGKYQAANFNIRARDTTFDGAAGLRIGSAIIDGRAVLYDQPEVVADVQLADTRYGAFYLNVARAKVDYQGGSGSAQALVEGNSGVPFRVAMNAALAPDMWRVALNGRSRGIAFNTVEPARIVPGDIYKLLPTTLNAGGGTVRLAGEYGNGMKLQSRMEGLDISIANAFMPGMGLGGKATGSLDFAQASATAFPTADARLNFSKFTRTSASIVSEPVDMAFVGKLLPDGGEARAIIRQRGSVIGRMEATLKPLGAGAGPWTTRLMEAPLGGGIRFNGPAATLFSFAGQAGQSLTGSLGVAADFSCRVNDPCISGVVRGKGLTYQYQAFGTRISDIELAGKFDGNRLLIDKLDGKAGDGTVSATGYLGLSAEAGYPLDLAIKLNRARLARGDDLSASATGDLRLSKTAPKQPALLSGQLRLPETRYKIVMQAASEVPQLSGVTFKRRRGPERITGDEPAESIISAFSLLRLDLRLRAPEKLYVSGMGLESEWSADLTVGGTTSAPNITGSVDLIRGTLGFAGRSFELKEGAVSFVGGTDFNPSVRVVASEDVDDVLVNVNIGGRAMNPEITFTSSPGLPQDEIVSRILFGSSIANLSAIQAVQLAASLNSLSGSGGGLNPLGKLRSATGIDRLRILGADEDSGRGTALAAGQYLTDDIYVELITDTRGFTATQLEVAITPWLSILSQAGGSGATNVNVRIKKNY